jgi:hypothetical protein
MQGIQVPGLGNAEGPGGDRMTVLNALVRSFQDPCLTLPSLLPLSFLALRTWSLTCPSAPLSGPFHRQRR